MGKTLRQCALAGLLLATACGPTRDDQLAALSSPEGCMTRAKAIVALGKGGDDENLGDIIAHVGDPDTDVRSRVAEALGNYDDRRAADALGELAGDAAEAVQVLAVRALARQKNPRARAYLLLAYRRDGSAVRAAVAEGLRDGGSSPADAVRAEAKAIWEQVSGALTKGSGVERAGAAEELGRSGRPEAVERLGPYLSADSRTIAVAAAGGLGASGLPQAREPLEALLTVEDTDLQLAALDGLAALNLPEAAPAIAKVASKGGKVGLEAVEILARLPGTAAALCQATQSEDEAVTARAAELLSGRAGGGAGCATAPLFAKLSHGPAQERAALAALAALGGTASEADARRIVALLRDGPPEVRPLAARAAGALRIAAAQGDLEKAWTDARARLASQRERWVKQELPPRYAPGWEPSAAVGGSYREHVEDLMNKLAVKGAHVDEDGLAPVGPLFGADPERDLALATEAGLALAAIAPARAAEVMKALAADPSPAARRAACRGALLLPGPEAWAALGTLSADDDSEVKGLALRLAAKFLRGADAAQKNAAAELFAALLANPDGATDDLAVEGLVAAGRAALPPTGIAVLTDALQRPGTAVAATAALTALAPPEVAVATLRERLRHGGGPALPELIGALAELKAPALATEVRPLLFHANPAVRAAAAEALRPAGDTASREDLAALREDYYGEVRRAVGQSAASPGSAPDRDGG